MKRKVWFFLLVFLMFFSIPLSLADTEYFDLGVNVTNTSEVQVSDWSETGTFTVAELNASDKEYFDLGVSVTLEEEPNQPPIANFTYNPSTPYTNEPIQFIDTSIDVDGSIVAWLWDFGNGAQSTGQNPVIAYSTAGNYTVTLTVWDDDGASNSTSKTVTVLNHLPIVNFTYTDPIKNKPTYFNSTSYDLDGEIINYTWIIENQTFYGANITYTFTEFGIYNVTLIVKDNSNATSDITKQIEVKNHPPVILSTFPKTAYFHVMYKVPLKAYDPENDTIIWGLISTATWLFIKDEPGNELLIGFPISAGKIYVRVYATDGNLTTWKNYTLTVKYNRNVIVVNKTTLATSNISILYKTKLFHFPRYKIKINITDNNTTILKLPTRYRYFFNLLVKKVDEVWVYGITPSGDWDKLTVTRINTSYWEIKSDLSSYKSIVVIPEPTFFERSSFWRKWIYRDIYG